MKQTIKKFIFLTIIVVSPFFPNVSKGQITIGKSVECRAILITKSNKIISAGKDNLITIWNIETKQVEKILKGHTDYIYSLSMDTSENILVSASWDKTIKVWSLKTYENNFTLSGHKEIIQSVYISKNGSLIASASGAVGSDIENVIKIWDAKDGKLMKTIGTHKAPIMGVVIYNNNKNLVSVSRDDKRAEIWDLQNYTLVKGIDIGNWSQELSVSNDGKYFVCGADTTIRLYNLVTNSWERRFKGHSLPILALSFLPDNENILSGSSDKKICLWNIKDDKPKQIYTFHEGTVTSISVSRDGKYFVSCDKLGKIICCEIKNPKNYFVLTNQ
jgi:WD40 repeat protein